MTRPSLQLPNFIRPIVWLGLIPALSISGCGSTPPPAAMTPTEMLDILEDDLKRHDPKSYVEFDLGKFKVTHTVRETETLVVVKFHLFGVLPGSKEEDFKRAAAKFDKRIRDAVILIIQQAETDRLTDAGLNSLKGEMVAAINRLTRTRVLKDVVFSEFSLERS